MNMGHSQNKHKISADFNANWQVTTYYNKWFWIHILLEYVISNILWYDTNHVGVNDFKHSEYNTNYIAVERL